MLRVHLDGGFACPEIFNYLDSQAVESLVVMGKKSEMAAPALAKAAFEAEGKTVAFYSQSQHAAQTWGYERRMIHRAEIVSLPGREPRENCRLVVTNLDEGADQVYDIYRQRGDSEIRIKELKEDLGLGRTSCHRFWANQLRVLTAAAAFVLMQELRSRLMNTGLASAQVGTLRLRLLKTGGRIESSVRRIVIHLAAAHPWARQWQQATRAWGEAVT